MPTSEDAVCGLKRDLVLENLSESKSVLHLRAKSGEKMLNITLHAGEYRVFDSRVIFGDDKNSAVLRDWIGKKIAAVFFYKRVALSFLSELVLLDGKFSLLVAKKLTRVPKKHKKPAVSAIIFSESGKNLISAVQKNDSAVFFRDKKYAMQTFCAAQSSINEPELLCVFEKGFAIGGTGDFPFSRGAQFKANLFCRINNQNLKRKIAAKCTLAGKISAIGNAKIWSAYFEFCDLLAEDCRFLYELSAQKKQV